MLRGRAAHVPFLGILWIALGLLLFLLIGYLIAEGSWTATSIIVVGLFSVCFLVWEERRIVQGKQTQLGILLWVLLQPFLRLINDPKTLIALQGVVPFLFLFYYRLLSQEEKKETLARCARMLVPGAIYFVPLVISYVYSGVTGSHDIYYLAGMVTALGFAFLACLCCKTYDDLERLLLIYALGGVIQLPIILLQASGLAEHLPGVLSQLSVSAWGGPLAEITSAVRYPGSFGDVELLAEYLGITLLLAIGLFATSRRLRFKWILLACACAIFVVGWFTGTRAFLLGSGVGLGVLVAGFLVQDKFDLSRVGKLLVVLAVMAFTFWAIIPDKVKTGFIARLSIIEFTGYRAFNRAFLYDIAGTMLNHLPFWGYGSGMLSAFNSAANYNYASPHSWYLSMLLIAGYPGLVCTGLFVLFLLWWSGWLSLWATGKKYRSMGILLLAVIVYWVVNEAKIEFLRQYNYANVLFFLWGVVCSAYSLARVTEKIGQEQLLTK